MKQVRCKTLSKTNHYRVYSGFTKSLCTCYCGCTGALGAKQGANGRQHSREVILEANILVCPGYIN